MAALKPFFVLTRPFHFMYGYAEMVLPRPRANKPAILHILSSQVPCRRNTFPSSPGNHNSLRNLLGRPWRFNELQKNLAGISQKVLTDNLRKMEQDGIIIRTAYPEAPPRVEYAISELGQSIRPILSAMEKFSIRYKAALKRD